ncbi:MAG: zinc ribbon domain-containing protein [Eubacterium sp.]|nr:zinc ribbon domain-containing protein [Eubacterium sp.]
MALIKCIECGKEISDRAERCIHCGCPITHSMENSNPSDSLETPMSEKQKQLYDLYVSAKSTCPNCGAQYKPESKFCAKCGAPKDLNNQTQNPNSTSYALQNSVTPSPYTQNTYVATQNVPQPRCMALGIIGFVFAIMGFFIWPIFFNVVGLILAIITCASNPKEEKEWIKPIWSYTNKARGIGIAAVTLNVLGIIFMIFNMVYYSALFSGMF